MKRKTEWRMFRHGPIRCLAAVEGHAMVRYRGCMVFVIDESEWDSLPICEANAQAPHAQ